ncbi:MAG TPA: hypothetical protein VN894_03840 [Polyangiaceae bacterium]|nr:hypothetical protein [Polyangiaceae bacterium]
MIPHPVLNTGLAKSSAMRLSAALLAPYPPGASSASLPNPSLSTSIAASRFWSAASAAPWAIPLVTITTHAPLSRSGIRPRVRSHGPRTFTFQISRGGAS